jgi:hypothetical protein
MGVSFWGDNALDELRFWKMVGHAVFPVDLDRSPPYFLPGQLDLPLQGRDPDRELY